jgi:hypothetical protein
MSWRRRDFLTRMFLAGAAGFILAPGCVYRRAANPSQSSQSSKAPESLYDSGFFEALSAGSASSAAQILPEVVRLIALKSAVDLVS